MGKAWEMGCKVPGNPARVSWEEHSICCIQKGVDKLATQQHPPHSVQDALQLLLCLHNKDAMLLVWLSPPGSPQWLHLLQPHVLQSAQQSPSPVFEGAVSIHPLSLHLFKPMTPKAKWHHTCRVTGPLFPWSLGFYPGQQIISENKMFASQIQQNQPILLIL